ncbi:hypothetical protein Hanom_Chr14g01258341 [Helianthus anomalus]
MNSCVGMLNKTEQKRSEPSGSVLNRTEFERKISARFPISKSNQAARFQTEPSTSIPPFGSVRLMNTPTCHGENTRVEGCSTREKLSTYPIISCHLNFPFNFSFYAKY